MGRNPMQDMLTETDPSDKGSNKSSSPRHNENYSLIGPVLGSSVNLNGYEGDNKFPVEKSVHIWGEKFLDKKFGREVKKIVLEVAPELRSMHG